MSGALCAAASGAPIAPLSVSLFLSGGSTDQIVLTASGTMTGTFGATVTGGVPPYNYAHSWVGAHAGLSIEFPSSQGTPIDFSGLTTSGMVASGTLNSVITDSGGNTYDVNAHGGGLPVSVTRG